MLLNRIKVIVSLRNAHLFSQKGGTFWEVNNWAYDFLNRID